MENDSAQIVQNGNKRLKTILAESRFHYTVLIIVSIATRFDLLFRSFPLSFDDGVYAMSVKHISQDSTPFQDVFSSQGPYFLSLISIPSQIFGFDSWSMRLVPFIAGLLGVLFTYKITCRFMNQNWAFFAALLVGFSGTYLRATTPITSDGIVATIILGCVLLTFKFLDNPNEPNAILLGISIGFGCGIKSIFMIPFLLFVVVATWRIGFKLRLIAGVTSVITFFIPFAIFGLSDVVEQSILYHLGKDESLDFYSNLSKILTTISSFDLVLLWFFFFSFMISDAYMAKAMKSRESVFKMFRARVLNSKNPYAFITFLSLGTIVLVAIQAPLFRNHIAIAIAPIAITCVWILYRFYKTQEFDLITQNRKLISIILFPIIAVSFGSAIYSTYSDAYIQGTPELKGAIKALGGLPDNAVILTNDPGLAFGASLDVPIGLEDTSRYRFLSDNENVNISLESFKEELRINKEICAYATAPLPITEELDLKNAAPNSWNQIYDDGYTIWINPDDKCVKS